MSDPTNEQAHLVFNGINGDRGQYDLPPMSAERLFAFIQGKEPPENLSELRFRYQQLTARHLGLKEGVDAKDIADSGWGIIFAHDADPALEEALEPLLDLRREQAGYYFRLYAGSEGYRPDESKSNFLARHGAGPGPADPQRVPYYLLIVGSPEAIPYRFQSQLDVQYAVGRIHFQTAQEYADYARSVVAAEKGEIRLPRRAAFFGVANEDDQATQLSARHLVEPLATHVQEQMPDWQIDTILREAATKARLAQLLGGEETPAVLFSASHGMGFDRGSPRQLPHQGALLCQDWPGPQAWQEPVPQEFYFAGDDLDGSGNLAGLIAFFFACYGGGTPLHDAFAKQAFAGQRTAIAPHAFLARLPCAMLSHPRGGALAAVGHVERAWGYSFLWPGAGAQTTVFESTMERLLRGYPLGSAVEYFNERYAELATVLNDELEEIEFGKQADPYEMAGMWTANNDARGYAIIGDPAVRLPVFEDGDDERRPALERATVTVELSASQKPETGGQGPAPDAQPRLDFGHAAAPGQVFTVLDGLAMIGAYTEEEAVAFGLGETREKVQEVARSLGDALGALAAELSTFSKNVTSLTVETYVSDDLADVDAADPAASGATRRATTRVSLDGDMKVVVPRQADALDESLWAIHTQMVNEAQANRAQMVKIAAEALTSLLSPVQRG